MADEPEVLTPEEALDPAAIAAALQEKMGPQIAEIVASAVDAKVKEFGLDKVDLKHGMFPGLVDVGEGDSLDVRMGKMYRLAITAPAAFEVKAMSEGTTTAGGYLVPDDERMEIIKRAVALTQLYPTCKRYQTTRDAVKTPSLTTDVEVSWDEAENASFDESDPALGQTSFTIHRMNALTYFSRELVADSVINVVEMVRELFAETVGAERDKMIVVGDGSNQPEGIFSASGITTVSAIGDVGYATLLEMDETVLEQYRTDPTCCWITNQTVRRYLRGITDDNDRPLFESPFERGAPYMFMDHPIHVNANVPTGEIWLGPLSKYWVMDREQLGFETTTTGGDTFKKHQVALKLWERWDGKLTYKTSCMVKGTGITGSSSTG